MDTTPEDLIRLHGPRLRALAASLVGDGDDADELVQRAWVAAWRSGTSTPRAWLERVVRRGASRLRSQRAAARERERRGARDEALGDAVSPLERREALGALATGLASLPADQAEVLMLRYADGRPPREVAETLGIPVETVRTRARRGRERLRAELERRDFDWRPALLAYAAPTARPELAATTAALTWTMKTSTVALLVSAAALTAFGVYLVDPGDGTDELALAKRSEDTSPAPVGAPGPEPVGPVRMEAETVSVADDPLEEEPHEEEVEEDEDLAEARTLRGVVRTDGGVALPDAEVRFGSATAVTDLAGEFDLTIPYVTAETPVVAFKPGYQPAVRTSYGDRARESSGDLGPVELVLHLDPADITGRLVDEDGDPCAEWEVDLYDVSAVAPASGDHRPAEDLAAGQPNRQRSGLDGSFVMGGLRTDRRYRLRAWNEETLQTFVSASIEAPASGYRFVLPLRDVHATLDGVVLGTDGAPLGGVRVRLTMVVDEREIDGIVQSNEMHTGQTVTTVEDGRFTFHDVPHTRVFLRFHGQDVVARPYDIRPESPVEDLRIVLPRQGRFELARETGSTLAPDTFEVWDLSGAPIAVKQSGAYPSPGRVSIESAEPATYRCGDDARWLVLFEGEREVRRLELRIRPGETVPMRY